MNKNKEHNENKEHEMEVGVRVDGGFYSLGLGFRNTGSKFMGFQRQDETETEFQSS